MHPPDPTVSYSDKNFPVLRGPPLAFILQHVQAYHFMKKRSFLKPKYFKLLDLPYLFLHIPDYKSQVISIRVLDSSFFLLNKNLKEATLTPLMPCCDLKELNTDQTITPILFTLFFIILMRFSTHLLNRGWRKLAATWQNPWKLLKIMPTKLAYNYMLLSGVLCLEKQIWYAWSPT